MAGVKTNARRADFSFGFPLLVLSFRRYLDKAHLSCGGPAVALAVPAAAALLVPGR